MGREATCVVERGGTRFEAKVLLETAAILIRGEQRETLPFESFSKAEARDGWLELTQGRVRTRLQLGADAAKWLEKIRNPPSLAKKLGIGEGTRVQVVGSLDGGVREQLAGARFVKTDADVVLVAATAIPDLAVLRELRATMKDDAAVWVAWPKGRKELTETHVRAEALGAGLVDVKVAAVSETLSGLKLVIRKADRGEKKT